MINCKICNKEFKRIQDNHLKLHNISVEEYVKQYGEIFSDEYKHKLTEMDYETILRL